jgi:hypothetical protein
VVRGGVKGGTESSLFIQALFRKTTRNMASSWHKMVTSRPKIASSPGGLPRAAREAPWPQKGGSLGPIYI